MNEESHEKDVLNELRSQLRSLQASLTALDEQMNTQPDVIELGLSVNDLHKQTASFSGALTRFSSHVLKQIEAREESWMKMQQTIKQEQDKAEKIITLNVGGRVFMTSKENLLRGKDTFFTAMLGGGNWKPNEKGEYFIDRDPNLFEYILKYLRTGKTDLDTGSDELQEEFDFYLIPLPGALKHQQTQPEPQGLTTSLLSDAVTKILLGILQPLGTVGKMLYKTSIHGFSTFHKYCDNKGPTLVLVKSTMGDILGGYAGESWLSDGSMKMGAFVFRLGSYLSIRRWT